MRNPKFDYGNTIFNLEIELVNNGKWFGNESEFFDSAVSIAESLFGGPRHVTDKGYILKGYESGYDLRQGRMDIEHHVIDLHKMIKGLDSLVHVHLKDRDLQNIKADDNGVYILELRNK